MERTGDGLYRLGADETHTPPKSPVIAETERLGCFARDAKPMEANGPLPMDTADAQEKIARFRSDIADLSREARSPLD